MTVTNSSPLDTHGYPAIATHGLVNFAVEAMAPVTIEGPASLLERNLMSPYVWPEGEGYFRILVRAVPKHKPFPDTGQIWAGWSRDGVTFTMADEPCLVGGHGEDDMGGVEDPSVHLSASGCYDVYYTGLHADRRRGTLLHARGERLESLRSLGHAFSRPPGVGSTKEASLYKVANEDWRLFFEYAEDGASRVGIARGAGPGGPWAVRSQPFEARPDSWDRWHLSTGPIVADKDHGPVMFYNGATEDGRWRIGWILLDRRGQTVLDRCVQPLLTPPPVKDRSATDIAFAASAFSQEDVIWLYYSLEDRRPMRAIVRRVHGLRETDMDGH